METSSEHAKKYPCPQCNAELVFSPSKGLMVCNYCGYSAPPDETGSMTEVHTQTYVDQAAVESVHEHDLEEWLAKAASSHETGWGVETRSFRCNSCNASITVEPNITATVCPFCGSHHVLAQERSTKLITPESLIPFQVDQKDAILKFRDWLRKGWFRPNEVKRIANQAEARVQGVYLPFWTFDAQTYSQWWAEAGHYYYVTEQYRDSRGQTSTRQVRKIRWVPASGNHNQFYDDVLVYATQSVKENILRKIYPFDTQKLIPYRPQYLAGWSAEEYQIDLAKGWEMGKETIQNLARSACAERVPGDTHRNLRVQTRFENLTFKHILLPVWIASYRINDKIYNFMVNGQTGRVQGEAPVSWWKVALAILIVLILLACIFIVMMIFDQNSGDGYSMLYPIQRWLSIALDLPSCTGIT